MQGAAAGSFSYNTAGQANSNAFFTGAADQIFGTPLVIDIDVTGAVAGQRSKIYAENGGQASSSASGNGNFASTQASVTGEGSIGTIQIAGAGQIGVEGLLDGISADGAVAGQDSLIESDNGGSASTSVTGGNGYQAETGGEFSGNGMYGTTQIAGAGRIGIDGLLDGISADGAVAGQDSLIESDNGGSVSSRATNSQGYEAGTAARYYGEGEIWGCYQGAAAGQTGIAGMASVDGAAAGQALQLDSDNGGSVSSSATNAHGYVAGTGAHYYGSGYIDTIQGAAAGQAGIHGLGSVDGAIAGQDSAIWQAPPMVYSGQIGNGINPGDAPPSYAYTHASSGNGYDQIELETRFNEMPTSTGPVVGISGNSIVQCAGAGRISVTGIFNAQGAAGFQGTEFSGFGLDTPDDQGTPTYQIVLSHQMTASATPGSEHDFTDYSAEGYQWAVAGMLTDGDDTIQGAAVGPHDPSF
jgi:hypothetical protein